MLFAGKSVAIENKLMGLIVIEANVDFCSQLIVQMIGGGGGLRLLHRIQQFHIIFGTCFQINI